MKTSRAASVVLIAAALPCWLLALRAARLWAELGRHADAGTARRELALVAGALALLGLLLLTATRLRSALRVNLALAVVSVTATLYLFEAWRAFDDTNARQRDEKLAVLESLNHDGKAAYGGVEPSQFTNWREGSAPRSLLADGRELLPLAGISRKLTVDCKEGEGQPWLTYVSDEHGFNNPQGLWGRAPVELAAVGDSFTAGSCVGPAQNLVGRLRQRFPTALNLGMAGSGPLIMLAELREYGPLARPRVVLWCHFGGNDLRDLRREREHPILIRYLENGFRQGLAERQGVVDAALLAYYEARLSESSANRVARSTSLGDFATLRFTRTLLGLAFFDPQAFAPTEQEFELFEAILESARAAVGSWGGGLHFVYLPAWQGSSRQIGSRSVVSLEAGMRRRVLSIVQRVDLPVVDVGRAFASHPDPASLFACPGCHYSAAGYVFVAERLLAALERPFPPADADAPQT